jgi:hydrogenase maturation factor
VRIEGDTAWLERSGTASLSAVEGVQVGDYVACHAGMVLERLEPDEAEALLAMLAEMDSLA